MDWIQVGSLAILIIGAFAWIYSDIRTIESHLDMHITAINERIDDQNARVDALNARSDQLYSIVIDLLKERK